MTEATLSKTIRKFMDKRGVDAAVFAVAHAIHTSGMAIPHKALSRKLRTMGNRLYNDGQKVTSILGDKILDDYDKKIAGNLKKRTK